MSIADEEDVPDDPLEAYLRDKRARRASPTGLEKAAERFQEFLSLNETEVENIEYLSKDDVSPNSPKEVTKYDIVPFVEYLRNEAEWADSTIGVRLAELSGMYNRYTPEYFEVNPITKARKGDLVELEPPSRQYPIPPHGDVATFLQKLKNPMQRAIWLLFLKQGDRLGEVYNLDLRDVNIDHPIMERSPYDKIEMRNVLHNRPDSVYISNDIVGGLDKDGPGDTVNGIERARSTKRNVATVFPLDGELKHALVRWLVARPPTPNNPSNPLFISVYSAKEGRFRRPSSNTLKRIVSGHAEEQGWNESDKDSINTHFGRHFFKNIIGPRLPEEHEDYLRGDLSNVEGAKKAYSTPDWFSEQSHSWSEARETYIREAISFNLPTLPISEIKDGRYY